MTDSGHEIEVKLRSQGVEWLEEAGMRLEVESPRHFEDNILYDTSDHALSRKLAILRVRDAQGTGVLTYKESNDQLSAESQFKKRLEVETQVGDPAILRSIFEKVGFQKFFRYQKYRTVYRATVPGSESLQVMLDETAIGNFIELEGTEAAISNAVKLLGITKADYILESYLSLQEENCRRQGRSLEDLLYPET
jgi:adenylate cyclase, class 2